MELRLSGTTVQMLMDNAHIRRGDGPLDASDVTDPADLLLNRAATRWYRAAKCVRMGKGTQYRGRISPGEASHLLDYIDSVAGALEGADAEGREEARTHRAQVEKAVGWLRRQGAAVDIEVDAHGIRTFYVIGSGIDEEARPASLAPGEIPWPEGDGSFHLTLGEGEWMHSPVSTKRPIVGPARVDFTRHPDGGIAVRMV